MAGIALPLRPRFFKRVPGKSAGAEALCAPLIAATAKRPPERFYRPGLDVLRLIAFLSVFEYHLSFLIQKPSPLLDSLRYTGAFGMCLFFTLSAFLITEILGREMRGTGTLNIKAFYLRRILRIWPLYFFFLGLITLLPHLHVLRSWAMPQGALLSFLLLSGNWYLILAGNFNNPVMILWSLSVEEQFYLAWPHVARAGKRALTILSIAVIAASYLLIAYQESRGVRYCNVWWNSLAQFQFFGIGALLSLALRGRSLYLSSRLRIEMIVATAGLWMVAAILNHKSLDEAQFHFNLSLSYLLAALGCVLILLAFLGLRKPPKAFIYLGKISFGLYVFHQAAIDVCGLLYTNLMRYHAPHLLLVPATAISSLILTIAAASLSYRYLETPFLQLKRRFEVAACKAI